MPELPEIETIRRELLPKIIGRRFAGVSLNWPKAVRQPAAEEFRRRLVGQAICGLERRGKYLIFHLSSGEALILHLRMSGLLLLNYPEPDRHIRASFCFDDGSRLIFSDPRKLGAMWLVNDEDSVVGGLGPEPLGTSFTPQFLGELLRGRSAPIKAVLLDQRLIAGIGNIYADEALFRAQIHPQKSARDLSEDEVRRLYAAIREVLESGIAHKGATMRNFRRPNGQRGDAHCFFKVPRGKGRPCPVCGTPIERIALRGRGTYFCPRCQGGSLTAMLSATPLTS